MARRKIKQHENHILCVLCDMRPHTAAEICKHTRITLKAVLNTIGRLQTKLNIQNVTDTRGTRFVWTDSSVFA